MHTTASDGALTPKELICRAADFGLNIISVTDHDTLSGLPEARKAAEEKNISFIPGIELSAEGDREVHILGYFISDGCKPFNDLLEALRQDRISRETKYLDKLKRMDMHISHDELCIPSGTFFSRPLLAKAMKAKGFVNSIQEAFSKYLAVGKPAYVPKLCIKAEEVFKTMRLAKATPVLAHPVLLKLNDDELDMLIKQWTDAGLMGIEVYHPSHSATDCIKFRNLAHKYNLLVTGGSDFHYEADSHHGELGQMLSSWDEASADASRLIASSA